MFTYNFEEDRFGNITIIQRVGGMPLREVFLQGDDADILRRDIEEVELLGKISRERLRQGHFSEERRVHDILDAYFG